MDIDGIETQIRLRDYATARRTRLDLIRADPRKFNRFLIPPCTIRMLSVTDAGGSHGGANFGLEEFYSAFSGPGLPHGLRFEITTAHRGSDPEGSADEEFFSFSGHDLSQYDVIWLFGIQSGGSALSEAELRAMSEFMDGGGGVFATGDHASLGAGLSAAVPRIRSMRKWYYPNPGPNGEPPAPPGSGAERLDTVHLRPGEATTVFNDESDWLPQKIRPKIYSSRAPFAFNGRYSWPHPVLCGRGGVIDILPDHAHEGECIVPDDLTASFTFEGYTIEEYPAVGAGRLQPEIIAWSQNQMGVLGGSKGAVNPATFGAIGVLDGHRVDIGRCAVDATWHHFFNVNLRGRTESADPLHGTGFTYDADALAALDRIRNYFLNLGIWLARPERQACLRWRSWWWARFDASVMMELELSGGSFEEVELEHALLIGRHARDAIGRFASQCQSLTYTIPVEVPDLIDEILWPILPDWAIRDLAPEELTRLEADPVSFHAAEATLDLLASAMVHRIYYEFPDLRDVERAEDMGDPSEILRPAVEQGLRRARDLAGRFAERGQGFAARLQERGGE